MDGNIYTDIQTPAGGDSHIRIQLNRDHTPSSTLVSAHQPFLPPSSASLLFVDLHTLCEIPRPAHDLEAPRQPVFLFASAAHGLAPVVFPASFHPGCFAPSQVLNHGSYWVAISDKTIALTRNRVSPPSSGGCPRSTPRSSTASRKTRRPRFEKMTARSSRSPSATSRRTRTGSRSTTCIVSYTLRPVADPQWI